MPIANAILSLARTVRTEEGRISVDNYATFEYYEGRLSVEEYNEIVRTLWEPVTRGVA